MEPDTRRHPLEGQSFEEVYPQYDFAPLVRLALAGAAWLKQHLQRKRPGKSRPVAGMRPAAH